MAAHNHLAGETSPYLLQHAHNPVDWYPWGPEALERARAEDKPIFLSIGYAACHWCHVMERESFEDPATAAELARDFVAIKVDREERPDLDQVYMAAVQAMTGQGGWPMSVFLTPDGRPFYGGTYFPPAPRGELPAFRQVLAGRGPRLAEPRASRSRPRASDSSRRWPSRLRVASLAPRRRPPGRRCRPALAIAAVATLETSFDARDGGWGRAPKFPQPMTIEFLLRRSPRSGADGGPGRPAHDPDDPRPMAAGGLHDQLGGGFHRYSTDADWLVPHFEQMLYDNAQLGPGLPPRLAAARRRARPGRRPWQRSMRSSGTSRPPTTGSRRAATPTRTASRARRSPGRRPRSAEPSGPPARRDAAMCAGRAAWDVTDGGNWPEGHGRTILRRVRADAELAAHVRAGRGRGPRATRAQPAGAPRRARSPSAARTATTRSWPAGTGWRSPPWPRPPWPSRAAGDAERRRALPGRRDRRPPRTCVERLLDAAPAGSDGAGRTAARPASGVLEDYACLAEGLLALYGATFDERWFGAARALADAILDRFADPAGGFFDTADDHEILITRPKDLQDNAVPSGNAMAATVLLRLAALTGEARYRDAAEAALRLVAEVAPRHPTFFAQWLVALDFALARRRRDRDRRRPGSVAATRAPARGRPCRIPSEPGRRRRRRAVVELDRAPRRRFAGRRPADRVRLPWVRLPAAGRPSRRRSARSSPGRASLPPDDARRRVRQPPSDRAPARRRSCPQARRPRCSSPSARIRWRSGLGCTSSRAAGSTRATASNECWTERRAGDAHRVAALRELFEEAGVLVADRADGSPVSAEPRLAAELLEPEAGARRRRPRPRRDSRAARPHPRDRPARADRALADTPGLSAPLRHPLLCGRAARRCRARPRPPRGGRPCLAHAGCGPDRDGRR